MIDGVGRYNHRNRLDSLDPSSTLACSTHWTSVHRLEEFTSLANGWLEGKGVAPNVNDLEWLTDQFEASYSPTAYPLRICIPRVKAAYRRNGVLGSVGSDARHRPEIEDGVLACTKPEQRQKRTNVKSTCHCLTVEVAYRSIDVARFWRHRQVNSSTTLIRQIHPSFIHEGRITSQAFRPTPKDKQAFNL